MNLLVVLLYIGIGCAEWWISLRRNLACVRGEIVMAVSLVFVENVLGLFVLSTIIKNDDWGIGIAYAIGGALGAYIVTRKGKKNEKSKS